MPPLPALAPHPRRHCPWPPLRPRTTPVQVGLRGGGARGDGRGGAADLGGGGCGGRRRGLEGGGRRHHPVAADAIAASLAEAARVDLFLFPDGGQPCRRLCADSEDEQAAMATKLGARLGPERQHRQESALILIYVARHGSPRSTSTPSSGTSPQVGGPPLPPLTTANSTLMSQSLSATTPRNRTARVKDTRLTRTALSSPSRWTRRRLHAATAAAQKQLACDKHPEGQHPPSPEITSIAPGADVEVDRDDGHHVFAKTPSRDDGHHVFAKMPSRALADQLCSTCTTNASTWDPTPWSCYSR